jgi:hypothetical protein
MAPKKLAKNAGLRIISFSILHTHDERAASDSTTHSKNVRTSSILGWRRPVLCEPLRQPSPTQDVNRCHNPARLRHRRIGHANQLPARPRRLAADGLSDGAREDVASALLCRGIGLLERATDALSGSACPRTL